MADTYTSQKIVTPCKLEEATAWWEEVKRVMGDAPADVVVIAGSDGKGCIVVTLHEET